ncbi:PREDICTED: uncharacterized protein LOC109157064 [Ipomoea nil]|uniref:uncharacterized protein LOC109157064 n=1 Tax=Ipomoea nil TaxID=35883 RepID=UPI000900A1E0|nr:PREDICTED: uncharacterized protein LOC109157064 [Ipomoea nil]
MNTDGDWIEGDAMTNVIMDYYRGIFNSSTPAIDDEFFGSIHSRVTGIQNENLLRPFEEKEVKTALFSMYPDKAPGPDGMNPGFYQHFCDVVGTDVSSYILNCLNTCSMPDKLNETNIILIPKKKTPEMVSDYRPIALSNVVYRVMAKVITARMKPLMESIISESQSAFISGRLITDNILIAAEVGHFLNRKQCGLTGWGALKLDMAKAYDRMEWAFLERMLRALGFDERWIELLMMCVTTVSYSVMVNGSKTDEITPTRGLRQANTQEAGVVKRCLSEYEKMSGQAVNYHKSNICYSKNTRAEIREEIADMLGVVQAQNFGKYLGLPSFVGRNRKSMPTFSMSVFLLPMTLCTAIERTMNRYWWRARDDQGIHWKAWDKLCIPKEYGGLGFKELRAFNLAMLGKQAWHFLTQPHSLVSRVYKARYYPTNSFYEACLGNNPSFCWRSILAAQDLICGGVRRRIGDGKSTLIWEHPWLQDMSHPKIVTEKPPQLAQAKVMGLMDQQTGTWDQEILADILDPGDVEQVLKIPVSPDYEDLWYWYGDPKGEYSVKNGYRTIVGNYTQTVGTFDKWKVLWKLKAPPRWKTFMWRALHDILPTTKNLLIKRVDIDPTCAMCGIGHEDIVHSLITCDYSTNIWAQFHLPIPNSVTNIFSDWFNDLMNTLDNDGIIYAVALLYYIWRARNGAVWEAVLPRPQKIIAMASSAVNSWKQAHPGLQVLATSSAAPSRTATVAASSNRTATVVDSHVATPNPTANRVITAELPAPIMDSQPTPHIRNQCYFDAAYDPHTNKAAVGAIILNWQGHYISAMTAPMINCFSPLMAEANACKEVLSWLRNRGIQSIDLFTDCLVLQQYLSSTTHSSRSYLGYAVDSCRTIMSSFDYCLLQYVPRLDNYLAHTLASTAFTQTTSMYSDYDPPASISAYFQ